MLPNKKKQNTFMDFIATNVFFNENNNDFKGLCQRKTQNKETYHCGL